MVALSWIAAALIVLGLFTPVAAASAVLLAGMAYLFCGLQTVNGLMIAILIAIALLGAGAYSFDARLYGRRRLVVVRGQQG